MNASSQGGSALASARQMDGRSTAWCTGQREALGALGVDPERIYVDRGLTGPGPTWVGRSPPGEEATPSS